MKLRFIYAPVAELGPALTYYRDTLGLLEAWREGDHTVAFRLSDSDVQIMVNVKSEPPGPMYQVPDLKEFLAGKPELEVLIQPREIPDGHVAGVTDPGGNVSYFFDQSPA